jgi:hypothetical protein
VAKSQRRQQHQQQQLHLNPPTTFRRCREESTTGRIRLVTPPTLLHDSRMHLTRRWSTCGRRTTRCMQPFKVALRRMGWVPSHARTQPRTRPPTHPRTDAPRSSVRHMHMLTLARTTEGSHANTAHARSPVNATLTLPRRAVTQTLRMHGHL